MKLRKKKPWSEEDGLMRLQRHSAASLDCLGTVQKYLTSAMNYYLGGGAVIGTVSEQQEGSNPGAEWDLSA